MSDSKASALNPAAVLTGSEIVPIVQAGGSVRTTATDLRNSGGEPLTFALQTGVQASPGAGKVKVFARNKAGRATLEIQGGATGEMDTALQPALFGNYVAEFWPTTGTTLTGRGAPWASVGGTITTPTLASTNLKTSMRRVNCNAGTTAGGVSGVRANTPLVWRGNAAGRGGFYFFCRWAWEGSIANGHQTFVGLGPNAGIGGNPSTTMADHIGLVVGTGDQSGTMFLSSRTGTGTATRVSYPVPWDTTKIYDFSLWCAPFSDRITARLYDQTAQAVIIDNVAVTATLPTNTVFLTPQCSLMTTNAFGTGIDVAQIYLEADL